MDYMFLNEIEDEANRPILVLHDNVTGCIWAFVANMFYNLLEHVENEPSKVAAQSYDGQDGDTTFEQVWKRRDEQKLLDVDYRSSLSEECSEFGLKRTLREGTAQGCKLRRSRRRTPE